LGLNIDWMHTKDKKCHLVVDSILIDASGQIEEFSNSSMQLMYNINWFDSWTLCKFPTWYCCQHFFARLQTIFSYISNCIHGLNCIIAKNPYFFLEQSLGKNWTPNEVALLCKIWGAKSLINSLIGPIIVQWIQKIVIIIQSISTIS